MEFDNAEHATREMVSNRDLWPYKVVLPLKHRTEYEGGFPVTGIIFAHEMLTVREGVLFALENGKTLKELADTLPARKYASAEEIIAEWIVD